MEGRPDVRLAERLARRPKSLPAKAALGEPRSDARTRSEEPRKGCIGVISIDHADATAAAGRQPPPIFWPPSFQAPPPPVERSPRGPRLVALLGQSRGRLRCHRHLPTCIRWGGLREAPGQPPDPPSARTPPRSSDRRGGGSRLGASLSPHIKTALRRSRGGYSNLARHQPRSGSPTVPARLEPAGSIVDLR